MTRRTGVPTRWLAFGLLFGLFCLVLAGPLASVQGQGADALRISAGDTTQTTTVLWALSASTGVVTFEYATDAAFSNILGAPTATVTDATRPVRVNLTGLTPGTRYYYRATDAGNRTRSGTFRTARAVGTSGGLRFGVSGDWRGELAPYPAIKNAAGRDLEFFIKLGDTIYADYPSPDVPVAQARTLSQFRAKHNEPIATRYNLNTWMDLRATTSILAMIDDHEVTNDFQGGALPNEDARFAVEGRYINETTFYRTGIQAFQEYMPIRNEVYGQTGDPRTAGKPKLYRSMSYGSQAAVFLVDGRSFRDKGLPPVQNPQDLNQVAAYWVEAFAPGRTMLGQQQFNDLKADLLAAQNAGILWKFIVFPEPIQNLGPAGASDRFEGYSAERTALIQYILQNNITNVAFIAADIHGTVVNNVTYQTVANGPVIQTSMFEITTGSVAFDAPFGPVVVQVLFNAGLITPLQKAIYDGASITVKDEIVRQILDQQAAYYGIDPVGLNGSQVTHTLLSGGWVAVHTFGWTEFEIDGANGQLTVTTYGIPPYSQAQLDANPTSITGRNPIVMQQFRVTPQ